MVAPMPTATYHLFLTCLLCFSLSACRPDIRAVRTPPLSRNQPSPTASQPDHSPPPPATSAPVTSSTRITAAEFLAHLPEQPADASLLHLDSGLLTPLDAAGKSASWTADFWSPSSGQRYTFTLINGIILTQSVSASPPEALLTVDSFDLTLANLLGKATEAGGAVYLKQGYWIAAQLQPNSQHPSVPIWTITYLKPEQPLLAFSVSLDARNGKLMNIEIFSNKE